MPRTTDVEGMARELAGNWKRFESFAWHARPDHHSEQWALVYTHNRDSGLLDQSNAHAIEKELSRFEGRTVRFESHNHWAHGHVDGFAIRVYRRNGQITRAFRAYAELVQSLEDYPILDESDYSAREHEAATKGIEDVGGRVARRDDWILPEDWESQVWDWLGEHEQRELENRDDQGAYPSEDAMRRAFDDLGYRREGMRRCDDCGEWCQDHEMIPGPIDDGFWTREQSEHSEDCHWSASRAGRI
jgi:hypothetical protein